MAGHDSWVEMHLPVEGRGGAGAGHGLGGRACQSLEGNEGGVFQLQGEYPPVLQQITCKVWDGSLPVCLSSLADPVLDHVFSILCVTTDN